jgi:hypothetical protein
MNYYGTLLFTKEEYKAFMACRLAMAYHPEHFDFEGKEIIVNNFEIEKDFGDGRYLVLKKWG